MSQLVTKQDRLSDDQELLVIGLLSFTQEDQLTHRIFT